MAAFTTFGLLPAACSLLLDDDAIQCRNDRDCARFPGTVCNLAGNVCIAQLQTGTGSQGGTQGAGLSGAGGGAAPAGGGTSGAPAMPSGTGGLAGNPGGGSGGSPGGSAGELGPTGTGGSGGAGTAGASGSGMGGCPDLDGNGVRDCLESLVANGDFASGIAGWLPELGTTASFSSSDGEGDPRSGALSVTNANRSDVASGLTMAGATTCLPNALASSYAVYLQVAIDPVPDGLAQAGITFTYYPTSDCSGSPNGIAPTNLVDQSATGWSVAQENIFPFSGTQSLLVRLVVVKPFSQPMAEALFDNVLIRAN